MRKLPAAAQEERRRQVIGLRERGLSYEAIAAQVGLSQTGVFNICQRFARAGMAGVASQRRGPAPGPRAGAGGRARNVHPRADLCTHPR
jgi:transposase